MAYLQIKTAQDLADTVGGNRSQVSNWLNAATSGNPPPVPFMLRLIEHVPELTLDWIYTGNADKLPYKLAVRLIALTEEMATPRVEAEPAGDPPPQPKAKRRDRVSAETHQPRGRAAI